jgi:hypothetical protein
MESGHQTDRAPTGRDADPDAERSDEERGSPGRPSARTEDDSPAERYGDSPGMGAIDPSKGVPEPNEPA